MKFKIFFEAKLQYNPEAKQSTSPLNRIGKFLGSGDGTVAGEKIKGKVRWDLYEAQKTNHCETGLAGFIDTNDGAVIEFDSRGFGVVPDPASSPNLWNMTATLKFKTDHNDYKWIEKTFAIWDGTFDMSKGIHNYTALMRDM